MAISEALFPPQPSRREGIPLDRVFERSKFPPLLMAITMLIAGFILFQVVFSPLAIAILLMLDGVAPGELLGAIITLPTERPDVMFVANAVGQVLGLGLPAWLMARGHSSRAAAFMRLKPVDVGLIGMAAVGLIALIPVIQWLTVVNQSVPLPDWLQQFEKAQNDLIRQALISQKNLLFNLVLLALTPAICEEILFRGYVQRQAERSLSVIGGILFSGIIFGLYHVRLSQLIPLSALGLYMAWLTWQTGSLLPAMIVHFLNNGLSVVLGWYVSNHSDLNMEELDKMQMPWVLVALGIVMFAWVVVMLRRRAIVLVPAASTDSANKEVERSGDE